MKLSNAGKTALILGAGIAVSVSLLLAWYSRGVTAPNLDSDYSALTVDSEVSLRFAAVGDFSANDNTRAVLEKIADERPDLTLALGDLSYGTVTEQEWCAMVTDALGDSHPFQLIAGNHDILANPDKPQGHIDNFAACLPNKMSGMKGEYAQNYYFDYESLARFIMISPDIAVDGREYSYEVGQADYDWLSNSIDDARESEIGWVIVGMHKNCITVGVKTCEIGTDLLDLLAEKKVDLVVQGHEHGYFRSKQLVVSDLCPSLQPDGYSDSCVENGDGEENKVYQKGEGTLLSIPGTGGQELRSVHIDRPDAQYFAYWSGKDEDPAYGPMIVDLEADRLNAHFSGVDGVRRDMFSINR